MNLADKIVIALGGVFVLCGALAVIAAPVPAQADQQARQFEQSYCFTATGVDRWKSCR